MQRFLSICSVCILLVASSCKKQIVTQSNQPLKIKKKKRNIDQEIERGEDIFSPVSESEAKQFALLDTVSQGEFYNLSHDISGISQNSFRYVSGNKISGIGYNSRKRDVSAVPLNSFNTNFCATLINVDTVDVRDDVAPIEDFAEFVRQKEAKLSDIPVPLGAHPLKRYFQKLPSQNKIMFGYRTNLGSNSANKGDILGNIVTFYLQEMERLGWKQVAFFDGFEKLMVFKKPSRFCAVSIRVLEPDGSASVFAPSILRPRFRTAQATSMDRSAVGQDDRDATEIKDFSEIPKQAKIIICTHV